MIEFSLEIVPIPVEVIMRKTKLLLIIVALSLAILACSIMSVDDIPTVMPEEKEVEPTSPPEPTPTAVPETEEVEEPEPEVEAVMPSTDEPVQLTGNIEISNASILRIYFYERFVMLEDLTGFIQRDYEYSQPLEGQVLGPVTVDEEAEEFTYLLNLPARPVSPFNDVDNNGETDKGVQIWQVAMNANYIDDPFLGEDEAGSWSSTYISTKTDSENKREIYAGTILVWASDADQGFPTGFGDDGLLFTADDPTAPIAAGYTIVNLDAEPFNFSKEQVVDITLYEGEVTVNDFSEMSWSAAFEAMHTKIALEYPFTELKGIDWQALFDEFGPRVAEAEADEDETAYFLALRDYSWAIPDGHVGVSSGEIGNQMFEEETAGGFGFAVTGLDDGRLIASIVLAEGPASDAGIEWGAEILAWDGQPVGDALAVVSPWSAPFSTEEAKIIQQYRYLLRAPLDTPIEVTFANPEAAPVTTVITATAERQTFSATSVFAGYDFNALPVEYRILPSGYGYIKINSLSEDLNLIIRLWEWALEVMIANDVPAIIIDMRQNSGGTPIGASLASYFVEERIDLGRSYYFSEKIGEFETYGPPSYTEPDQDLHYDGQLGILVSSACMSACEDVAYTLGLLEQTRVFGFHASNGIFGEVARGQYVLPGGYSFQAPTGMERDMDGNIIIEGTGVVPDMRVPMNAETVKAQFVDGQDVVLNFAIETIDQPLGAGITPAHPPTISTVAEAEAALQANTKILDDIVKEEYADEELSMAGRVYTYTAALNKSEDLVWLTGWCTADEESFNDNWSKIEIEFALNNENIPLDNFAILEGEFSDSLCRFYYTVLSDWAIGENLVQTTVTFSAELNDGISDIIYPAGTHTYEYRIFIGRE
jgi:C-terminal processing protease CtpA/Prc